MVEVKKIGNVLIGLGVILMIMFFTWYFTLSLYVGSLDSLNYDGSSYDVEEGRLYFIGKETGVSSIIINENYVYWYNADIDKMEYYYLPINQEGEGGVQ